MNPNMKSHLKDQLLQALMHYMSAETRRKIMLEVPAAYNDFYGGGSPPVTVCYTQGLTPVGTESAVARVVFDPTVTVQEANGELPD